MSDFVPQESLAPLTFQNHDFWKAKSGRRAFQVINRVIGANSYTFDLQDVVTSVTYTSGTGYLNDVADAVTGSTLNRVYIDSDQYYAAPPILEKGNAYIFTNRARFFEGDIFYPIPAVPTYALPTE